MTTYTYTNQNITDTRALRSALATAGEAIPIYTVMGGDVNVETETLSEAQVDAAVSTAND